MIKHRIGRSGLIRQESKEDNTQGGLYGMIVSLFNSRQTDPDKDMCEDGHQDKQLHSIKKVIQNDRKFMKTLKHELKLFEVCQRIYEQECI